MKLVLMILALGIALQLSAQQQATNHPYRIMVGGFVAEHDYSPAAKEEELVRSKLISSLSRECNDLCVVTEQALEDDTKVDAVLTGSWLIENCYNCKLRMQGALRLVAKDGAVLWSDTVYSSRFSRGITSSFTDNAAKKLVSHLASKPLPAGGD